MPHYGTDQDTYDRAGNPAARKAASQVKLFMDVSGSSAVCVGPPEIGRAHV